MQTLRHDDQRAGLGVVEPTDHGRGDPAEDIVPTRLGEGIVRLHRIVDDDEVRALAGQGPSHRGGETPTPVVADAQLLGRGLARIEPEMREHGLMPGGLDQAPRLAAEGLGEIGIVACPDDAHRGVAAQGTRSRRPRSCNGISGGGAAAGSGAAGPRRARPVPARSRSPGCSGPEERAFPGRVPGTPGAHRRAGSVRIRAAMFEANTSCGVRSLGSIIIGVTSLGVLDQFQPVGMGEGHLESLRPRRGGPLAEVRSRRCPSANRGRSSRRAVCPSARRRRVSGPPPRWRAS